MNFKKDKYEISLWEDVIVNAVYDEKDKSKLLVPEHYEENKICVIGSNTMTAQFRAREPKLVENVNGTNTFTFKIFYTYIDNETGEKKINPFINLLVNERKVKVFWKNKWYNLIIKNIQEDSNGKSITYTCKDIYINELSKTGFDIVFSTELENNYGSVDELAQLVVEDTDWKLGKSDLIQQFEEEPVYEVTKSEIVNSFSAIDQNKKSYTINNDNKILLYYSVVQKALDLIESNNTNAGLFFQFLYESSNSFTFELDSQLVNNGSCLIVKKVIPKKEGKSICFYSDGKKIVSIKEEKAISTQYRAKRLVYSQKTTFDNLVDSTVGIYKFIGTSKEAEELKITKNTTIYGYKDLQHKTPLKVVNLLANNSNFSDTEGWICNTGSGDKAIGIRFQQYPYELTLDDNKELIKATSYLRIPGNSSKSVNCLNTTIDAHSQYLDTGGFQPKEKYVCRIKIKKNKTDSEGNSIPGAYYTATECNSKDSTGWPAIRPNIYDYNIDSDTRIVHRLDNYFSWSDKEFWKTGEDHWIETTLTCKKAITKTELLTENIGFILVNNTGKALWLEEIQLYLLVNNDEGERLNPGDLEKNGVAFPVYKYYNGDLNISNIDDLDFLYCDIKEWDKVEPVYKDNYEKVRSIEIKESNRFNIIQTLAETFECWAKFEINCDPDTGKILYYDEKNNYTGPQKYIYFVKEVGKQTGIGFVYGIDLKTISRTITSDQIVTKTLVRPNNNEYAEAGSCAISRASDNLPKTEYILNFDYYVQKGLLDGGQMDKDLYQTGSDSLSYFNNLRKLNKDHQKLSTERSELKLELTDMESMHISYNTAYEEAQKELNVQLNNMIGQADLKNEATWEDIKDYQKNNPKDSNFQGYYTTYNIQEKNIKEYEKLANSAKKKIDYLNGEIEDKEKKLKDKEKNIKELDLKFYKKYSRFIQEGTWISEEYVDDNLYYYDGKSVSYTSSRPQIQYNISVLRLSALDEYKGKVFNVGDISYIQDTEFFGYVLNEGNRTPYRELVLISEIVSNFDSPENDSIKIQNYKTQFEDLFQRVVASTNALQFASGEYAKAASVVTPTGEINPITLQNSIANNNNIVITSQNESIKQDNTGITLSDLKNANKKVKIVSGGILLSKDGGKSWVTGVSADGIGTPYLTSGSINTESIVITNGSQNTFRWDANGINAYVHNNNYIKTNEFVRFDQYGIYGMKSTDKEKQTEEGFIPNSEQDIWDNADFGLTWKGFFLRNRASGGGIEISTEEDIVVYSESDNKTVNRIKIGRLDTIGVGEGASSTYGIRIKDDGTLWIKSKLNIGTFIDNYKVAIGKLDSSDEDLYYEVDISKFEDDETYYIKENGSFKEVIKGAAFDSNTTYYIKSKHGGRIIDANSNFVVYEDGHIIASSGSFYGHIEATSGSFQGAIYATSGVFNGTINAFDGYIGTSQITSDGLKVVNSGLSIVKQSYEPVNNITTENFIPNIYYIYNSETDSYILSDSFNEAAQYFVFSENPLLYYDEDKKQLNITGDTYFSGNIDAFSGTFSGTLSSPIGDIGGFIIENNQLFSKRGKFLSEPERQENLQRFEEGVRYYTKENNSDGSDNFYKVASIFDETQVYYTGNNFSPEIILYGENGKIIANNIVLGSSASIADYIKLGDGNAYIYNPEKSPNNSRNFLQVNFEDQPVFALNDQGEMALGQIYLDGKNSSLSIGQGIQAFGETSILKGNQWNITPEKATFNDIVITKGIFKTGEIQSLGGSMLFKPAGSCVIEGTKIISVNEKTTADEINKEIGIIDGSWVLLTKLNEFSTEPIQVRLIINNDTNIKHYELIPNNNEKTDFSEYDTITYYCTTENETNSIKIIDGLMIGVNSGDSSSGFLAPRSISFTEVRLKENGVPTTKLSPSLLVGDLSALQYIVIDELEDFSPIFLKNSFKIEEAQFEPNKYYKKTFELYELSENKESTENGNQEDNHLENSIEQYILSSVYEEGVEYYSKGEYYYYNSASRKYEKVEDTTPFDKNQKYFLSGYMNKDGIICTPDDLISYEGFGLYGENVYLNGTLTTKVDNNSFAGINTISGVNATIFKNYGIVDYNGEYDTSKIVFWGGANSRNNEDIQSANFQVTENGSIYANQGIFEGTLITKSTIEGSIIRAAKLYGWKVTNSNGDMVREEAPLGIYNTNLGIQFREEIEKEDETKEKIDNLILELASSGFTVYGKNNYSHNDLTFLTFNNEEAPSVDANLRNIEFSTLQNKYLYCKTNTLKYCNILEDGTTAYGSYIWLYRNGGRLGICRENDGQALDSNFVIQFNSSEAQITKDCIVNSNMFLGTRDKGVSFQRYYTIKDDDTSEFKGYDLYVS